MRTAYFDCFAGAGGDMIVASMLDAGLEQKFLVSQLESLGIEAPCVISLAKREEEIFVPGRSEPLRLSRDSYSLRLLEYVRDEAHRFAQHYHHLLRNKRSFDDLP